jgi:hypothetical protein
MLLNTYNPWRDHIYKRNNSIYFLKGFGFISFKLLNHTDQTSRTLTPREWHSAKSCYGSNSYTDLINSGVIDTGHIIMFWQFFNTEQGSKQTFLK